MNGDSYVYLFVPLILLYVVYISSQIYGIYKLSSQKFQATK